MTSRSSLISISLAIALLTPLSACSSNLGQALQRVFSADPNANRWGQSGAELPADFPAELRYPNATLQQVSPRENQSSGDNNPSNSPIQRQLRWITPDPPQQVQNFYQQIFRKAGWSEANQSTEAGETILVARRPDLQVRVSIPNRPTSAPAPNAQPTGNFGTQFTLNYIQRATTAEQSPQAEPPQPGDPNFVGPTPATTAETGSSQQLSDLDQAPPQLRSYLEDLAQLEVLKTQSSSFNPNKPVSRRDFARWLVDANNRIYGDQPGRQIRLTSGSAQPVFQDVPRNDPGFAAIQGLADAGYIPSPISESSTSATFRPGAPLTREDLLTWKVPVDLRRALPTASVDAVKQTWGFKDANRIAPNALPAVAADYQNGDLSNIRRIYGSTLLLQPKKPATRAEAAAALWYIGTQGDGLSARDALKGQAAANSNNQ